MVYGLDSNVLTNIVSSAHTDTIDEPPANRDSFDMDGRRDWDESSWDQPASLATKHRQQTSHHDVENRNENLIDSRLSPTSDLKRRRKMPSVLSEEEKHLVI